jgi:hypothetical protein
MVVYPTTLVCLQVALFPSPDNCKPVTELAAPGADPMKLDGCFIGACTTTQVRKRECVGEVSEFGRGREQKWRILVLDRSPALPLSCPSSTYAYQCTFIHTLHVCLQEDLILAALVLEAAMASGAKPVPTTNPNARRVTPGSLQVQYSMGYGREEEPGRCRCSIGPCHTFYIVLG